MKSHEAHIRLKTFQVDDKRRKVLQIESMIAEFERIANDLDREIRVEQDRSGIHDPRTTPIRPTPRPRWRAATISSTPPTNCAPSSWTPRSRCRRPATNAARSSCSASVSAPRKTPAARPISTRSVSCARGRRWRDLAFPVDSALGLDPGRAPVFRRTCDVNALTGAGRAAGRRIGPAIDAGTSATHRRRPTSRRRRTPRRTSCWCN